MFEATVIESENLLRINYVGRIGADEAMRCGVLVKSLLPRLRSGFRLLSDLQKLVAMDLECVPFIEQVMDWCDDAGIEMIVRVIPDPKKDIGLNIMSLFHYRRGVRIVTCQTLKEAEAVLGRSAPGS